VTSEHNPAWTRAVFFITVCILTSRNMLVMLQVARLAKTMVAQCGFSKELGQVAWQQSGGPAFLGQEVGQAPECSGETQNQIDEQVKALVDRAYR
jgi:ATP-dependent Zn protease